MWGGNDTAVNLSLTSVTRVKLEIREVFPFKLPC